MTNTVLTAFGDKSMQNNSILKNHSKWNSILEYMDDDSYIINCFDLDGNKFIQYYSTGELKSILSNKIDAMNELSKRIKFLNSGSITSNYEIKMEIVNFIHVNKL